MKRLLFLLIFITVTLLSCSDEAERIVTVVLKGGNDFDSVSKVQIIRSYDGEEIDVTEIVAEKDEGLDTVRELFFLEGTKLEFRAFAGDKHELYRFEGAINSDNTIGTMTVNSDSKVEIIFHFNPEILIEPTISGNTYQVSHSSHIRWIANETTNIVQNDFSGKTISMTRDIYMEGIDFGGISQGSSEFNGTFDGNGFTINNICIYTETGGSTGFICNLGSSGKVVNLGINGKLEAIPLIPGYYVGSIVGKGNGSSSIDNVFSEVEISVASSIVDVYVGGIAGGGNVTINRAYNAGLISASSSSSSSIAAGIMAFGGSIKNAYNTGEILGVGNISVAGISGSSSIEYAYNVGRVSSVSGKMGGVSVSGNANECYYLKVQGGVNDGLSATADFPGNVEYSYVPLQFGFMNSFKNFDTTIWKIKDNLKTGSGNNIAVSQRPIIIELGEGK